MRSLHLGQATAAVLLLAVPFGLTACSSGKSHSATSPSSSVSTAPAPAGTTSSDQSKTAESAKPSKAEVAAGMRSYFVGKGVPRSLVGGVTDCVAAKGYSQFSDATLRALRNGRVNELNPLDAGKLTKVTTDCLASGSVPSAG